MNNQRCSDVLLLVLFVACHSMASGQETVPKKVEIGDGVALHYIERGEGEPIIFVHGLLDDYSTWRRQLEGFANQKYRAIAYSRRHNYPNENPIRPKHSASLEADDLAAFMVRMKLKKAHIVGHSYGAYTALFMALKYPDRLLTMTLAEPPIVPWLEDLAGNQAEAGKAQLVKLMSRGINPAKAAFKSGNEEAAIRIMFDCIGGEGKYNTLPRFVKEKCRRNIAELKALIASDDRYPDVDRKRVRRSTVPTLILSGENSVATAKLTDPELERLIPKQLRKRVVFDEATHIMMIEQPARFRNSILEFIVENRQK